MIKKLLLLALIALPSASQANEMCYDRAINTVARAKQALMSCSPHINVASLDALENALEIKGVFGGRYTTRVTLAVGRLYEMYNSTLPYDPATRDNACIQTEVKKFSELKLAVLDAMVFCTR